MVSIILKDVSVAEEVELVLPKLILKCDRVMGKGEKLTLRLKDRKWRGVIVGFEGWETVTTSTPNDLVSMFSSQQDELVRVYTIRGKLDPKEGKDAEAS